MKTLQERFRDASNMDDWGDWYLEDEVALDEVKQWLQDQYREYAGDDGMARGPGIRWAASYLGDGTCPTCIGTGLSTYYGTGYTKKEKACMNCDGKGSI